MAKAGKAATTAPTATAYSTAAADGTMSSGAITVGGNLSTLASGGGQPHPNRQPYLAINFCIALQGIFPSPN